MAYEQENDHLENGGWSKKVAAGWNNLSGGKHRDQSGLDDNARIQQNEADQYQKNQDYNRYMGNADQVYLAQMHKNAGSRQGDLDTMRGEIEADQKKSSLNYDSQIQPRMKNLMETAHDNAAGAMTLQQSMDPNNAVASKTRTLYNTEGQSGQDIYNQQAKNEGRQGLADAGTMQAMGMQNLAGQLGNSPMTGGQMQALMGQNSAQSGAAYAGTQRRMQSLRDQGLGRNMDLRSQGLAAGEGATDKAYNRGTRAQDQYGQAVGNYEQAGDRQLGRSEHFRGQRDQNSGQSYGVQQQMADTDRGVANAGTMRDMAVYNTHMGGQQANIAGNIAQQNANQTATAQQRTGLMTAAGTVAGAYFGGPAGAAAGNQAGQAAGNSMAPAPQATAQYGTYPGGQTQTPPPNYVEQNSQNGLSLTGQMNRKPRR